MKMSEHILPATGEIRQRAYGLFLERGGEDGHDLADWFAAERELTELSAQAASASPKVRAAAAGQSATSTTAGRAIKGAPMKSSKHSREFPN
jgi:hypothetical protein